MKKMVSLTLVLSMVISANVFGIDRADNLLSRRDFIDACKIDSEIEPASSGNLAPGKYLVYDYQTIHAGQTVSIDIEYTPTDVEMRVGVYNPDKDEIISGYVVDGSGVGTITIHETGTYGIYIGNPSDASVHFNASYFIN